MSHSWRSRKARLSELLRSEGDEEADGLALDRLLHGQNVIGRTSRTAEIDAIRFQNKDLKVLGTLEFGQFGVVDVVNCRMDGRVYIRKSIEKQIALRNRQQCFPQLERDLLVRARLSQTAWAPHLVCAFQTLTHLNLIMDYAEGGTLWDVLESSPHDGRIPESDLKWWTPQLVGSHHMPRTRSSTKSSNAAPRDIKPHNFVLTQSAHVQLIDFGSAAPLLPPCEDGSQRIAKRYCLVPCGTCDYISPEILNAHEQALVALEMEDEGASGPTEGYGRECDWWSLGAMLYELAYGVAPFFARDVGQTYAKIMNHKRSLRMKTSVPLSAAYCDLLKRLLTDAEFRLGRLSVQEIIAHTFFEDVDWVSLPSSSPPPGIHLPQFAYNEQPAVSMDASPSYADFSKSQGFRFSALFQSSSDAAPSTGAPSMHQSTGPPSMLQSSIGSASSTSSDQTASFIGFSWGPPIDAFPSQQPASPVHSTPLRLPSSTPSLFTPAPPSLRTPAPPSFLTPAPPTFSSAARMQTPGPIPGRSASAPVSHAFITPLRGVPNTAPPSTIRRSVLPPRSSQTARRTISDREAMRLLVDCVGMSARKRVLDSGRKPRLLKDLGGGFGSLKKALRFEEPPEFSLHSRSGASGNSRLGSGNEESGNEESVDEPTPRPARRMPPPTLVVPPLADKRVPLNVGFSDETMHIDDARGRLDDSRRYNDPDDSSLTPLETDTETETESEGPPSPSPRPGSALSRSRSQTPTLTSTFLRSATPTLSAFAFQRSASLGAPTPTTQSFSQVGMGTGIGMSKIERSLGADSVRSAASGSRVASGSRLVPRSKLATGSKPATGSTLAQGSKPATGSKLATVSKSEASGSKEPRNGRPVQVRRGSAPLLNAPPSGPSAPLATSTPRPKRRASDADRRAPEPSRKPVDVNTTANDDDRRRHPTERSRHARSMSTTTFTDEGFESLELRYTQLVRDIKAIESRLGLLTTGTVK
ncbi:kinase-like domain-containing protein [Schizophyllum commune]